MCTTKLCFTLQEDVPTVAKLLYVQCLIHMLLHDDLNPSNEAFLGSFAHTSHLTADDCTRLEAQAEGGVASVFIRAFPVRSRRSRQLYVSVAFVMSCVRAPTFPRSLAFPAYMATHPELVDAYSWGSTAKRLQDRVTVKCIDTCLRVRRVWELAFPVVKYIWFQILRTAGAHDQARFRNCVKCGLSDTHTTFSTLCSIGTSSLPRSPRPKS